MIGQKQIEVTGNYYQSQIVKPSDFGLDEDDLELIKDICLPYKVIAAEARVGEIAVSMRVGRISRKLRVSGRAAIVAKALRLGFIRIEDLRYQEYGVGRREEVVNV